jgi:protein-tyrosine phosphatase
VEKLLIDLHCHILPALDDGARDVEDSVGMALQAASDGIAAVCATPHIRRDHVVDIDSIAGRVAALQAELDRRGLAVRLVPGGELSALDADGLGAEELGRVALGGEGGWLLLEPAPGPIDGALGELVGRLHARGLRVIVAHPERHAGPDFVARLHELSAAGCLIQWTADFIARAGEGDPVLELAREGLIHVLGSDAHSSRAGRPVALTAGLRRLQDVCSPQQVDWIAEQAPRAVLDRRAVEPPW